MFCIFKPWGIFQAVGCGFDSRLPLQAGVAQLVEHLICNQRVGGSNPSASSIDSRYATLRSLSRRIRQRRKSTGKSTWYNRFTPQDSLGTLLDVHELLKSQQIGRAH